MNEISQPDKMPTENTSPTRRPTARANAVGMTNSTAISFRVIAEASFDLPLTRQHHLRLSRANQECRIRTLAISRISHHRNRLLIPVEVRPYISTALAANFADEPRFDIRSNTINRVDFYIAKVKFYERFRGQFKERKQKSWRACSKRALTGVQGWPSAENYISITKTSRAAATTGLLLAPAGAERSAKRAVPNRRSPACMITPQHPALVYCGLFILQGDRIPHASGVLLFTLVLICFYTDDDFCQRRKK